MSLPDIEGHTLLGLIGSGGCGVVYRARTAEGVECAVKVFSSMAVNRKALMLTAETLSAVAVHEGVVAPFAHQFENSPYYWAVPLFGEPGMDEAGRSMWAVETLEDWCQQGIAAGTAWVVIYKLADALAWLHKEGLPHGNLRPCNVLVSEVEGEPMVRLTDMAQGWVGRVHHLELGDHFVYLCPEQAEHPEGVFAGYGPSWDVYSFGVMAYRTLTGRLPRAEEEWHAQLLKARQRAAAGLIPEIDSKALLAAVVAQPEVTWPHPPASKWEERRRQVLEKALSAEPEARWKDMREVLGEFEALEADFLLEESREQTAAVRQWQESKMKALTRTTLGLVAVLTVASGYLAFTMFRAKEAEQAITNISSVYEVEMNQRAAKAKAEIAERERRLAVLAAEREQAQEDKSQAEANLDRSRATVDQFLTQLLQTPTGNALEVEFSRAQLEESLVFCQASLEKIAGEPGLEVERARMLGNLGRIHLKLHQDKEAEEMLGKALAETVKLKGQAGGGARQAIYNQWAGRFGLMLAELKQRHGDGVEALELLKEAAPLLQAGLAVDPANRMARSECARAWLDLGARSFDLGDQAAAREALMKVPAALEVVAGGGKLESEDAFLLARAGFYLGLVKREEGRLEESLTQMIDAVRGMGDQVMGSAPRNQDQALMLAEAYTVLAELVGQHFNGKDALGAHQQAVPILLELNRLHPDWAEVKYFLARNNGAIAQLERDLGQTTEAVRKKQDAIELINEVLADHAQNRRYLFLQAKLRYEYAGFLADAGKAVEAVAMADLAEVALLALVEGGAESKLTPDLKQRLVLLAQCQGLIGHGMEKAGRKAEAKAVFEKSLATWKRLEQAGVVDDLVKQGIVWTQDRFAKIK